MRTSKGCLILLVLLSAVVPMTVKSICAWAYTDEIAAPIGQVWTAAHQAMEAIGISRDNIEKRTLESDWVEDELMRESRSFLRGIVKKKYYRRTKFKVELTDQTYSVQVSVTAEFQFKPKDSWRATPWRELKPGKDDRLVEQQFFYQIIKRLEQIKRSNPS